MSSRSSRQTRNAALFAAAAATVLSLAACGSSTPDEPTASSTSPSAEASPSPSPTSAAPGPEKVRAAGQVSSVSGGTIGLSAKKGPTTVALTPTTKILRVSPAQFTDVSTGSCVDVRLAAPVSEAPPAPAKSVTVSTPANGKCAQASQGKAVRGTVTAVNGQTVSVASSAAEPTAIPVDEKTQYFRQTTAGAPDITQGVCLSAVGTVDPGGALQAANARIGPPAANGSCPGA